MLGVVLIFILALSTTSQANNYLPVSYGSNFGDTTLPRADDGSFPVPLKFKLWDRDITEYFVSNTPAGIYLLKVNNRNTRTRCEISSELTKKTPERRHWRRSGAFIVNFEHISHLVLVFLLLTLNR